MVKVKGTVLEIQSLLRDQIKAKNRYAQLVYCFAGLLRYNFLAVFFSNILSACILVWYFVVNAVVRKFGFVFKVHIKGRMFLCT